MAGAPRDEGQGRKRHWVAPRLVMIEPGSERFEAISDRLGPGDKPDRHD